MLTLRTARLFVTAAETATLTAAAEQLHVSQPAATKSLAQLEAELGGPLFERSGRKLVLTRMGEALLPRARALLQQANDLKAEAERWRSGEDGVLNLGAGPSLTYRLLPEAVARYYRAGRTVQLTIHAGAAGALVEQVRRGALDLVAADMGEADLDPSLTVHPLPEESVAALVRPGHPALDGASPKHFPLATATPPERLTRQPLPWGGDRPGLVCDDYTVLALACAASDHVLAAPRSVMDRLTAEHGLVPLPDSSVEIRLRPALIYRANAPHSAARDDLFACFEAAARNA
ncbi:LysR family transcriptional regulator [Oceanicaulis sp. MMSF_3324]|uniref:LysR family transcriptional regulator n=1 Tax=Oceanicaulis sp. MMSF_3324 TaxID=3046702 RepID=UPI00273DF884|nr:LysR family transcriptional regulator [Oceanicaulis sp. MMSF_3324]